MRRKNCVLMANRNVRGRKLSRNQGRIGFLSWKIIRSQKLVWHCIKNENFLHQTKIITSAMVRVGPVAPIVKVSDLPDHMNKIKDAKKPVGGCLSMFGNIVRQIIANHLRWALEGRPLNERSADISTQTRQKGGIYYSTKTICP